MKEQTNAIDRGRADLQAWEEEKPRNFYDTDTNFRRVLEMHLSERYELLWPRLARAGGLAATEMDQLARACNDCDHLPALRRTTSFGERREEVAVDPRQRQLDRLAWSTGVLSCLAEPGHEVLSGGLSYLMGHNGEAGVSCEVACTAGAIKLIQRQGSREQRERYLPRLLDEDPSRHLVASQFVTEIQGGSDVGANATLAVPMADRPGWFRLTGEKWFCSVIDAGLFVVTARPQGGEDGTRGLGLFLMPRKMNGQVNGFDIQRLKDKLGTRSLPTAEIALQGAMAEAIGPLDQGFKNLVSIVLDTSRLQNAVANCGMMRRAFVEAQTYSQHRRSFGQPIVEHPMVQQILARMRTLTMATLANTFRILGQTDCIDLSRQESEDLAVARRVNVNINKIWASMRCTEVVRDGMEVLGGNGTIEDFSILPRLYRDAMVLESWEGTHNTLCAQVLRDFQGRSMHIPWLEDMRQALGRVNQSNLSNYKERGLVLLGDVQHRIAFLLDSEPLLASSLIRHVVERMSVLSAYASLLLELDWEIARERGDGKHDALQFFRHMYLDPVDPLEGQHQIQMIRRLASEGVEIHRSGG